MLLFYVFVYYIAVKITTLLSNAYHVDNCRQEILGNLQAAQSLGTKTDLLAFAHLLYTITAHILRAVASMRQDLASSKFYAKIKKSTVGKIIPRKHLQLSEKRLTQVLKVYEKGFEKTQVVCIPAISFICVVICIPRQLIDPNPQAAHPENRLTKVKPFREAVPMFSKAILSHFLIYIA